jgi:hypothetical protein
MILISAGAIDLNVNPETTLRKIVLLCASPAVLLKLILNSSNVRGAKNGSKVLKEGVLPIVPVVA